MLPIRDENPQIRTPYVTYALIALNVLVWALLQGFGTEPALSASICRLGLIPGDLLGTVVNTAPSRFAPCPIDGEAQVFTTVSSMFMHGSWLHLVGNLWFLWIFGNNVEDAMGPIRFAVFYLVCGLAAAAAQIVADTASPIPMVGASGAIGGVMGAYIVLYPRVHVHMFIFLGVMATTIAVPAVFMLGYWALLQVVEGVVSIGAQGGGVAFWAHIGGFAAGALLIFAFKNERLLAEHPYRGWRQRGHRESAWHRVSRRGRWY